MRGEYSRIFTSASSRYGSPPHAWGIRLRCNRQVPRLRFTPTCVGNTPAPPCSAHIRPVHPHMRGEYLFRTPLPGALIGSPPHAWGIRSHYPHLRPWYRFTPTCVGNTLTTESRPGFLTVHPHMRGEYVFHPGSNPKDHGSPPHAWGIPHHARLV